MFNLRIIYYELQMLTFAAKRRNYFPPNQMFQFYFQKKKKKTYDK